MKKINSSFLQYAIKHILIFNIKQGVIKKFTGLTNFPNLIQRNQLFYSLNWFYLHVEEKYREDEIWVTNIFDLVVNVLKPKQK